MKGYVIVYATTNLDVCESRAIINECLPNFGLARMTVYKTEEDARNAMEEVIQIDSENLTSYYYDEDENNDDDYEPFGDGYFIDKTNGTSEGEKDLTVYFNGEIVSVTTYKIEEVAF